MGRVLVACEFSGVVRDAFRARGHEAWSCDLLPCERNEWWHIQDDVRNVLESQSGWGSWDLMIAHPPCTYLANSGVQHLRVDVDRWDRMLEGREFFIDMLTTDVPRIAVENPIPHKYAELPPYDQIVHPWQFGHEAQKKTCLWLENLPPLVPTKIVGKGEQYIGRDGKPNGSAWYQLPPSVDRWKYRSRTFSGIAEAMADQWGKLI